MGERSSAVPVLLSRCIGGALSEGGALGWSVEVPEGVGVLAVEVGGVDEAGLLGFVIEVDVRRMGLGLVDSWAMPSSQPSTN